MTFNLKIKPNHTTNTPNSYYFIDYHILYKTLNLSHNLPPSNQGSSENRELLPLPTTFYKWLSICRGKYPSI